MPLLAALLTLGAVGGCATSAQPQGGLDVAEPPRIDGVDLLGNAETGARMPFALEGPGRVAEVVVGRPYTAASGRRCRPLADAGGTALGRLVCEAGGHWRLVRSLEPDGGLDRDRFESETARTPLVIVPTERPPK